MNQSSRTESKSTAATGWKSLLALSCAAAVLLSTSAALQAQPTDVFVNPTYTPGPTLFRTIQAAVNAVASGGTVHVDPGTYIEDITVAKPLTLLGPNAGKAGTDPTRGAEAILMPQTDDAANGQIIYVSASGVTIDGFLFNGDNPALQDGYPVGTSTLASEVNTSAAVQNTYFWTTDFAQVDHLRIQNNIIQNIAYDGIYLEVTLGSQNGFNYILNNKFQTMWEGLQTYAAHSVISNNTFVSVNRGLSVHGTTTAAPAGFTPVIANNTFTIGEWWPTEIGRLRTAGVWVNYRRDDAAPLEVIGNVVNTPVAAPAGKTVRGFYALNVDGKGRVTFISNTVNGGGNCMEGLTVALVAKPGAVSLLGGALNGVSQAGVLATTKDLDWGIGGAFVTVSNVAINMTAGAGVVVSQDPSTTNRAHAEVIADCAIAGGATGVRVVGTNATAVLIGNDGSLSGNGIGLEVDRGKALVQENDLSGNTQAGIRVMNHGLVDAGDCSGGNITGLGTSTGGNDLSGYAFDGTRLAIDNWTANTVRAYQNYFGVAAGQNIANTVAGPVQYSQTPLFLTSPTDITVRCVGEIPVVAQNYATFVSLGGIASASQITSVSYTDSLLNPPVGNQDVTRTWTVVDICGQSGQCEQIIHVLDTTAPSIVAPTAVTVNPDSGQCYATATTVALGSPIAADNCGVASVVNNAPAQFPTGPTMVTWTVTDINGLTATATQLVTVRDTLAPVINVPADILRGVDPGQNYSTVTFSATATDCSAYNILASPASGSHFPVGTNIVMLTATDTSGNSSTASFKVAVLAAAAPVLQLTSYNAGTGAAIISLTGTTPLRYALQTTTDFVTWTPLTTNTAPFTFTDTTGGSLRFYRALYVQ